MKKIIFIGFVLSLFLVLILNGCGGGIPQPPQQTPTPTTTPTPSPTPLFADYFDYSDSSFPTNPETPPWTLVTGTGWTVDTTNHCLERANSSVSSIVLYNNGSSWTTYSVSAKINPNSSAAGSYQGIIARSSSNGKYYYALLLSGGSLILRKHSITFDTELGPGGIPMPREVPVNTTLDSAACTYSTTTFNTLTLEVNDTQITGYYNKGLGDQVMVQSTDTSYNAGTIGLYSEGDAVAFDNVVVLP